MNKKLHLKTELDLSGKSFPVLRHIFDSPVFGVILMLLILLSVVLIVIETFISLPVEWGIRLQHVSDILTIVFLIELSLRWLISASTSTFLKSFWIDIIAVMPVFRIFRIGRVLRIMRILRILRLFRFFSIGSTFHKRFSFLSRLFENRLTEIGIISSFALFAIIFGAVGLSQFEMPVSENLVTPIDAFWKSLFSLMAGEYADYPRSFGGKIVFLILLIFEMGVFAMLTGTISAIMVDKLKETTMHRQTNPDELNKHIIICGFGQKAAILANEFIIDPAFADTEILIVSQKADLEFLKRKHVDTNRISILAEDFTRMSTLQKAGVERAVAAVIISEDGENRTTQDIDARTILAALTIEKLNPTIHTSAEIYNEEYATHLKMGGVEDVVIQGEVSGKLLARISMHEGLLAFFKDLLSRESGNTLSFIETPKGIVGKNISEVLGSLNKDYKITLVGVKPQNMPLIVNPCDHIFKDTDELLVIIPV